MRRILSAVLIAAALACSGCEPAVLSGNGHPKTSIMLNPLPQPGFYRPPLPPLPGG